MEQERISWPGVSSWVNGWRFRVSAWTSPKSAGGGPSFAALDEIGELGAAVGASWSFHLAPQFDAEAARVRLLANGFQIEADTPKGTLHALIPEAGVLWGESQLPVAPALFSPDGQVSEHDGWAHLRAPGGGVLLMVRHEGLLTRFCLVNRDLDPDGLAEIAQRYFALPLAACMRDELDSRTAFWRAHDGKSGTNAAEALEDLIGLLRAPRGVLGHRWNAGAQAGDEVFDLNDIFPLVLAWTEVDREIAEEILRSALSLQRDDGLFPSRLHVDAGRAAPAAAVPLLAQAARHVWRANPSGSFAAEVVPALSAYVAAALQHYDPHNRGVLRWNDAEEALTPETYSPSVANADTTVLMLCEIEALVELCAAAGHNDLGEEKFALAREQLSGSLTGFFWNRRKGFFRDRIPGDEHLERANINAWLPICWEDLESRHREAVLTGIRDVIESGGHVGVPAWEPWQGDHSSSPVYALHQLLIMDALRRVDAAPEHRLLSSIAACMVRRMHEETGGWTADLRPRRKAQGGTRPLAAATLALALTLPADADAAADTAVATSPLLAYLDSRRVVLVGSLVALLSFAVITVSLGYTHRRDLNYATLRALDGLARHHYDNRRYAEAAEVYEELLRKGYNSNANMIRYANSCFHQGRLTDAERCYMQLLQQDLDSPIPLFNLAVTLYRQNRYPEAMQCYAKAVDVYRTTHPELAERAQLALRLITEQQQVAAAKQNP